MEQICKKCGNYAAGAAYSIHHGMPIPNSGERIGATRREMARRGFRKVPQVYTRITAETLFLCDRCVRRSALKYFWYPFLGGLALTAILIFVIPPTRELLRSSGWLELAFIDLMAFVAAMGFLFKKQHLKGEDLAIEYFKWETKSKDTFWNSAQFEKLTPEQAP